MKGDAMGAKKKCSDGEANAAYQTPEMAVIDGAGAGR
jgi:hypothetical protein